VGSQGRKRGRRTRSDRGGSRVNIDDGVGFPEFEHNQWTFEGEIERLGALARGSHRVSGWRRTLAVVVAVPFLVTFVVGLVRLLAAVIRFVLG
jgi:hypothetical protein